VSLLTGDKAQENRIRKARVKKRVKNRVLRKSLDVNLKEDPLPNKKTLGAFTFVILPEF
jgi:hypothetical protein